MRTISLILIFIAVIATSISCKKELTPEPEPETGTVTDVDGNVYKTIKIGTQIWMAENLKSTHYSDGSLVTSYSYNNNDANIEVYGRLYAWSAAMKGAASSNSNPGNVQGIAPAGWHIPSKAEWQQLIDHLGGVGVAGGKMKETGSTHWSSSNLGATNESGFNALPAGVYAFWKEFQWKGDFCSFLSTTNTSTTDHPAFSGIKLNNNNAEAIIADFHPDDALSVRCVKN